MEENSRAIGQLEGKLDAIEKSLQDIKSNLLRMDQEIKDLKFSLARYSGLFGVLGALGTMLAQYLIAKLKFTL